MSQQAPSTTSQDTLFDPTSPVFLQDPYPYYHRMREAAPIHRNPAGGWLLTRYHDCRAALQDPRLGKVENLGCYTDKHLDGAAKGSDADVRMRDTTKQGLSPGAIRRIESDVRKIVDDLLDPMIEVGQADLVKDFCDPLAATVFCEIFGVPVADRTIFSSWGEAVVEGLDFIVNDAEGVTDRRNRAVADFAEYLGNLIEERRKNPADDLLSAMVAGYREAGGTSDEELLFHCAYLLPAGQAPTAAFLANAVFALLRHPDEFTRLRDVDGVIATAIEEFVRYEPPAHIAVRAARTDMKLGGQTIVEGETVTILMGSANRDPEVFAEPDRLDLTRDPNPHIAFGIGPHYCLGAPLGRMEGAIGLRTLARRAPGLTLAGTPEYKRTFARRALASLPVSFG